jgi:hypothetical protein
MLGLCSAGPQGAPEATKVRACAWVVHGLRGHWLGDSRKQKTPSIEFKRNSSATLNMCFAERRWSMRHHERWSGSKCALMLSLALTHKASCWCGKGLDAYRHR